MYRFSRPLQARLASGINSMLGAWLVLSPWIFGDGPGGARVMWANVLTGTVIGTLGMVRSLWPRDGVGLSRSNIFLGSWTALLPWTVGFINNPGEAWNCVIVGFAVMVFGSWSVVATTTDRAHRPP